MGKVFNVFKDGEVERPLDIHDYLVKNSSATFFLKMEVDGPDGSDIKVDDVLVVDRSLTPRPGKLVVVAIEGELKVFTYQKNQDEEMVLWGVVTGLLRQLS